ncbi:type II toxin-antitoxin system HicB family antitoxin [Lactobacillus agrestimuris]|uniref:type II toxin-antitoxin system HicB family antitoxin n=1 Tax=Lactobacillus agrestimuris TaxID=2941328 RepID=UPI0020437D82|nr:type II toxin-antitoxin system HicB family antitoxin [Lactobacillus agrestimuris]
MRKDLDKIVVFPIIISKDEESTDYPYLVNIPDLDGMTEGKDIADAIEMAQDYIGTYSLESELPKSNTVIPKTGKDEIATLVTVNISEYKRKNDNRVIKKTITIPNYLNELGKEKGINFSEVMSNALKKELSIQ